MNRTRNQWRRDRTDVEDRSEKELGCMERTGTGTDHAEIITGNQGMECSNRLNKELGRG